MQRVEPAANCWMEGQHNIGRVQVQTVRCIRARIQPAANKEAAAAKDSSDSSGSDDSLPPTLLMTRRCWQRAYARIISSTRLSHGPVCRCVIPLSWHETMMDKLTMEVEGVQMHCPMIWTGQGMALSFRGSSELGKLHSG